MRLVRIVLDGLTEEVAKYRYYPEDSGDYGVVTLDRRNGNRIYETQAEGYGQTYAAHALKRIEEYQKRGDFPQEDTVAWY